MAPSPELRPSAAAPWARRPPSAPLQRAAPGAVGLDADELARIPAILREGLEHQPPRFAGASVLVASRGAVVLEHAEGWAVGWQDAATPLPAGQRVPARTDTLYDIASLTKIVTAVAVLQLVEQGVLGLEDPVARHLPRFATGGKEQVTVAHLLTHVSGLPALIDLGAVGPDPAAQREAVLTAAPSTGPGESYVYSDLGPITLGWLVEELTGQRLDGHVREHITGPLGMGETMFRPPAALRPRIAATEFSAADGEILRGRVHDENAAALGGVAGHAGLFSTAGDLAILGQMLLGGGQHGEARILRPATVEAMFTDRIAAITGPGGARRGLGPELEAPRYHGGLTSPWSGVHTGFTGTSMVIDPLSDTIVVLLTNAVHPARERAGAMATRREVSSCVARAAGQGAGRDG
ncbi:serine hydrolase [Brachybacterium sp. YJGR34]|uniref:serine hydrolase domain-containing protein n=1 Tax=Brachybacterium sp. YJGR34 TaxID=2059911 RepID=UPI000E0B3A91|nr:serine hydrolase domain-containing protein [Brachybacterium sp. YJGR34]